MRTYRPATQKSLVARAFMGLIAALAPFASLAPIAGFRRKPARAVVASGPSTKFHERRMRATLKVDQIWR